MVPTNCLLTDWNRRRKPPEQCSGLAFYALYGANLLNS